MKQWFFIHTYSGHENKVRESLEARIRDMELAEQITGVLLPKEKVVEMRGNKEYVSERFSLSRESCQKKDEYTLLKKQPGMLY